MLVLNFPEHSHLALGKDNWYLEHGKRHRTVKFKSLLVKPQKQEFEKEHWILIRTFFPGTRKPSSGCPEKHRFSSVIWGMSFLVVNDHLWLSLGLGNSQDPSPSDDRLGMLGQVYELLTGTKGGLQQGSQRAPGTGWQILYKLLDSETVLHLNASIAHKTFWSLCLFLFCLSPFGNNCNHLPTSYQRYSHPHLLSDCFVSVPRENSLLFFMLN